MSITYIIIVKNNIYLNRNNAVTVHYMSYNKEKYF